MKSTTTRGTLLHWSISTFQANGLYGAGTLLLASIACAVVDFILNTVLVAVLPYMKRDRWPTVRDLFGNFGWVGATFMASASVACLLFLTVQQSGAGVLLAAAPIIGLVLATLHYYFRQQEADELARENSRAAAEREAELIARHVRELEISEHRFHRAFTHASIGMALVSFEGQILQANAALRALFSEWDDAALDHRPFSDFVHPEDEVQLSYRLLQLYANKVASFAADLRLRSNGEQTKWVAIHGSVFSEAQAAEPCLILQLQDISARRNAESELQRIAFQDSLTGLANRRQFLTDLQNALDRSRVQPERQFGLLFLDFDRFKMINDSLGHMVGDEFLKAVAARIADQTRPNDIVARLGGDEFAVLAMDLDSQGYAQSLADRLLSALKKPFRIGDTEITTSASIGITVSATGYATPAEMLRDADTAMYKAKSGGKARYALFDSALHTEVVRRLRIEHDLRQAIDRETLELTYQPVVDLASGDVIAFEALVRWNHPEFGEIDPLTFTTVAEESGLGAALTDFVLIRACRHLRAWQLRDERFAKLQVRVNIAGADLAHPGLMARVAAAVLESGLRPENLALELTEEGLMARMAAAMPTLNELRRIGVGLTIDHFGTGHSALRYLSNLPFDTVKVDRLFVADLVQGPEKAQVARAVLQLAQSIGKGVVAEGIESSVQLEVLRRMGCRWGQGPLLAMPLETDAVVSLLDAGASWQAASAATRPASMAECP